MGVDEPCRETRGQGLPTQQKSAIPHHISRSVTNLRDRLIRLRLISLELGSM